MNTVDIPDEYPTDANLANALHDPAFPPKIAHVRFVRGGSATGIASGEVRLLLPALSLDASVSLPWRVRWVGDDQEPLLEPLDGAQWRIGDSSIPLTSDVVAWVDLRQDLWAAQVVEMLSGSR